MKAFARFVVTEPLVLPTMIGNLSTSSVPLQTWNDFWGKITATKNQQIPLRRIHLLCMLLLIGCSAYVGYLIWIHRVFTYVFLPMIWTVLILSRFLSGPFSSYFLSGMQAVCSEFSASFQSAGFSITCQEEGFRGNLKGGYIIYIYPTTLDFLRVEIADETLLDCSTKESPMIAANDSAPISADIIASETWNQFWSTIEKEATAYTVASRRIFVAFVLLYLFCVVAIATTDSITVLYSLWLPYVLWGLRFGYAIFTTKRIPQATVSTLRSRHIVIDSQSRASTWNIEMSMIGLGSKM
jgi:hypothetical protein